MEDFFRKLDRGWARGERALIVVILIAIVFVMGLSAVIRNLSRAGVVWAAHALGNMFWTDAFLRTATLWLAFLGASQATYYRRHIRIDLVVQRLPLKARYIVHAAIGIGSGLAMFALTYSLAGIVLITLRDLPVDYGILAGDGVKHVCDASARELEAVDGVDVPHAFCLARAALAWVGIPAEGPVAMFRGLLPITFSVIGFRFLGMGFAAGAAVARGTEAMQALEAAEQLRLAEARAELGGEPLATTGARKETGA